MSTSTAGGVSPETNFFESVIAPFKVSLAGAEYTYSEYLALPADSRSNDEADVVDIRFTQGVLEWLGFHKAEGHFTYNRTAPGGSLRPDFTAHGAVGTAFIWEDKNTADEFGEEHIEQLQKYAVGTAGYAVWSNARTMIALRFDARGQHQTLVEVDVEALCDSATDTEQKKKQEAALELFYLLFSRDRFTSFEPLLDKICVDEQTFLNQAQSLVGASARTHFVTGGRQVLDHLRLAALQQIQLALRQQEVIPGTEAALRVEWRESKLSILDRLSGAVITESRQALSTLIDEVERRLGDLTEQDFATDRFQKACLAEGAQRLSTADKSVVDDWVGGAKRINAALRHLRLTSVEERRINDAFQVWAERQPLPDLASPEIFAEQVAYVLFVRLLLARVLEDKGLLDQRIVSDGGFAAWRDVVARYFGANGGKIHADSFMSLLSESLSRYYHHFFRQPVFDWFIPDDFMLLEALDFLSRYNFEDVESDLLGFTYEEYVDRVARNKKGHFLTRPEVVDYMLDLAGYEGPTVIGQRFLDPACGSGSFLVNGLRRYREAVIHSICRRNAVDRAEALDNSDTREEIANLTIEAATSLFHGMDIDPFACYLAELNLLIQVLEDLHYLWNRGQRVAIDRFLIFNTDSLALPHSVLNSTSAAQDQHDFLRSTADEISDETFTIKAKSDGYGAGFSYVIANPPYINPRQEKLGIDYGQHPFFREALSGVTNTYILFLRLGMHYVAQGGTICFIVPLTLLGDSSSKAIRALLTSNGFEPNSLVRFYTGNVLFPGIDQATSIVTAVRGPTEKLTVGGGVSVVEAGGSQTQVNQEEVVQSATSQMAWTPWLVSPDMRAYLVWRHVKNACGNTVGELTEGKLTTKQGDANTAYIKPFLRTQMPDGDCLALYRGDDILRFAPLSKPKEWLDVRRDEAGLTSSQRNVNRELRRIFSTSVERGIVRRHVQRLNTRYELIATLFERGTENNFAFTDGTYRYICAEDVSQDWLRAFLAVVNSRVFSYLLNLFSTNNNVLDENLFALPVPELDSFPIPQLSEICSDLIKLRTRLQTSFVDAFGALLPERGQTMYLPPDLVLAKSSMPTISLNEAVLRGIMSIIGAPGRIETLLRRDRVTFHGDCAFEETARLLLGTAQNENWTSALSTVRLPDPSVVGAWLSRYKSLLSELQSLWTKFQTGQSAIDDIVCDWYGFDSTAREAIREGLPWATRPSE